MELDKQEQLFTDWLRIWLVTGHGGEYPEDALIEFLAAINDDLPLLCLDQYLS